MSTGELNIDDLEGLVGRELDGRYLLDQFIDRGGFGVVYRGIDKKFNSPVAVKVGLSYREFMKEAKLAAEVRHDNIVQVSDYGNDHGLAYLVMEFLHGDDLEKLFKNQGNSLTTDQLRKLVSEVGDALAHAHSDQLIHRDLKPRNIILKTSRSRTGSTSHPARFVLLDFGIAAKLDEKGTKRNRTQDGAGTVEYMAPELLRTSPVATQQSDIYAFGVILYQMMTGRVPFQQSDNSHMALAECLNAIAHQPPPTFAEVAPDRKYPAGAEAVVMECLSKEPARRPATMAEVRNRFLEALEPVLASHQSRRPREMSQTLRPGELDDTAPNPEQHAGWNSDQRPRQPPSRWPGVVITLVVLAALVFGLRRSFWPAPTFATSSVLSAITGAGAEPVAIDDSKPVDLVSGQKFNVAFEIQDLPRGVTPEFAAPDAPQGVIIKEEASTTSSRTYSVMIDDPNFRSDSPLEVVFRASASSLSEPLEEKLLITPKPPAAWLPENLRSLGFRSASDSRLCRVGDEIFSTVLERPVGNETVRFLLVPATDVGDRRFRTFYIMERLVTKAQFQSFTNSVPDYEVAKRVGDDHRWQKGPDGPVTDVYALEAQKFARWVAGPTGSLPSTSEWELAAGYHTFRQLLETRLMKAAQDMTPDEVLQVTRMRHTQPLLEADVWVGKGPTLGEFHPAQGTSCKGCSPYGLKFDKLGTGFLAAEITSTMTTFADDVLDLRNLTSGDTLHDEKKLRDGLYTALLRGFFRSEGDSQEELWVKSLEKGGQAVRSIKELDVGSVTVLPGLEGIGFDAYISFRVVITTENNGNSSAHGQKRSTDYFVAN